MCAKARAGINDIVGNDCMLCTGKWMYEVTLQTSGLMQIGWATLQCQVSLEVVTIISKFLVTC